MANIRQRNNTPSTTQRGDGKINKSQISPAFLKEILNSESTGGGSVSMAIKKHSICVTSNINKVHIGYSGFNRNKDSLLVFKNGVYQEIDIDYVLNSDNTISKKNGENWEGTTEVPECFNFLCIISTSTPSGEPNVYMSVSNDVTVDQWILNGEGLYVANFTHSLNSEKLIVSAIDANTKKSVFISYRIVDKNTIELKHDVNSPIRLLIINSEDSTIQDMPSESINVISIDKTEWIEESGKFTKVITHNLSTRDIMINAFDNDSNKNLMLSYELLDDNKFKVISSEAYNCKILLVYRSVTSLNPSFKINDELVSTETTFSSDKIMKLIGGGVPFSAYESFNTISVSKNMWTLDEGIHKCTIKHNLNTKTLLLNSFDISDGRSLLISYVLQDKNTIILESNTAYDCDLVVGYSTKTNPAFKINDDIVSEETTYSSKKIVDIVGSGTGGAKGNIKKFTIQDTQFILLNDVYEYTLNHNMNSDITSILCTNSQNEQVDFAYKIVDDNNMKIRLAEAETIDIVLVGLVTVENTITSAKAKDITIEDSTNILESTNVEDALAEIKRDNNSKASTDTVGDLNSLNTSDKSSIVNAIKEVKTEVSGVQKYKLTEDNGTPFGYSGQDLNNINGCKTVFGSNLVNSPEQGQDIWWTVENAINCEYGHQIATEWHSDRRMMRNKRAGSWSTWRSL